MYQLLSEPQLKQQIDAEQTYAAWQDANTKAQGFTGGMHWKTIAGQKYLYKTMDRTGQAKSLGRQTEATQAIAARFNEQKAQAKARLESLEASLHTHKKINFALRLGSAPSIVAQLCKRLHQAQWLGHNLTIIGTHSLWAYEAMAGVRFIREMTATTDIDLLWDHQARIRLAYSDDVDEPSLLALLKKVDKSFQIMGDQGYRAVNDQGYMVDLIRQMPSSPWKQETDQFFAPHDLVAVDIWNMKWLINAPKVHQTAIALNGDMFPICAPDPRAYAMFKLWLSQSDERDPLKKSRDAAQAQAVASLIKDRLPHLAQNWDQISSFPHAVAQSAEAKLLAG
jgi:hypothetical protein